MATLHADATPLMLAASPTCRPLQEPYNRLDVTLALTLTAVASKFAITFMIPAVACAACCGVSNPVAPPLVMLPLLLL